MKKNSDIALSGILLALACALSYIESITPLPLPIGAKPGLANVVVMFSAIRLNLKNTLSIAILKSFFVFLTRGFTAFLLSTSGGFVSLAVILILFRFSKCSITFTSAVGSISHNCAQLIMAGIFYYQSLLPVTAYFPVMIITGSVTGIFTGTILALLLKYCKLK